jgi:hypothetical protein
MLEGCFPALENAKKRVSTVSPEVSSKKQKWSLESPQLEQCIVKAFAEFVAFNMESVPKDIISLHVGYLNPDSRTFKEAFGKLVKDDMVQPMRGGYGLTAEGLQCMPVVTAPQSNAEVHERLLRIVLKKKKKGLQDKLMVVWGLLCDGEAHDIKSLAQAALYSNKDSQGFKAIISALKDLHFVEYIKGRSLRFKDIMFPFKESAVVDPQG